MPLLNRRPYQFNSFWDAGVLHGDEVWVVKATGEVCRSYEVYLQKMQLYDQPVWSCKYTSKGGLTLDEVQVCENKALSALKTFPKELEEQVCRAVHHSLLRVDELVSSIYDSLRSAAPHEAQAAAVAAGMEHAMAVQQDNPSPFGSKENEPQQGAAGAGVGAGAPLAEKPAPAAPSGGKPAEGDAPVPAEAATKAEPITAKKSEGGAAAGVAAGERGKSGKKPKMQKAPVSKHVLRTFIIVHAEQQGPEHATKQVWVIRPELRERYGLAQELPADIQAKLAAWVKAPKKNTEAPKGLGTKLPAKKDKKAVAVAGNAGPPWASTSTCGSGRAAAAAASGVKEATPPKEKGPMVRVEAKPLEEVEKQYKEGTLKHVLVAVLKAVQPEALNVQDIVDKAMELGLRELEDKEKSRVPNALATDPNFLRISKGAYSLHCFHPDKEQLVKAPQPKKPKEAKEAKKAAAAAAAGTPAPGAAHPGKGGASMADKEKKAVPMVRVKPKSWEEVEKQYKEGTLKHMLVTVLKAVQPEALTAHGILEKGKQLGIDGLEEKVKKIPNALTTDPNFLRISKGTYSLHCFHPDKEQLVKAPQPKKRKMEFLDDEEPGSNWQEGSTAMQAGEEVDSITRAEQHLKQTKRALALHRSALEKAQVEYDAAKAAYKEDRKRAKTPAKERRESDVLIPVEQLAQFELSEEDRRYKGESEDRKSLLEHRQKLQARVKELEKAKKAFLEVERQKRKVTQEGSKESRVVELAFRKAERAVEHERRAAESAEKAAAAAEKKLEKEKDKVLRGEEKAKEREEREKQKMVEREEREQRRAKAAKAKEEAKRYPMEDLELLAELLQKAANAGEEVPDEDVEQPSWMSAKDSQRLSTALYVADFVCQFSKQLGCHTLNYEHLEKVLADATSGGGSEDDYNAFLLHTVYERLIRVILDDLRDEEKATAQEKRWAALLGVGTWPEVLRRFVLTRAAEKEPHLHPDQPAIMSASMLAYYPVDKLTHDQHLALLRFLCDTVLDSDKMRAVLQRREDEAVDVKRDVREELAEQRKQLKELLDAEKEERKRKREEERRAAEEEKAVATAAAAAAEGSEGAAAASQQQDSQKSLSKQASGVSPIAVGEPSFELPERLKEFTGASDDKKALVQWRQEQQVEKRRLDKERNTWMGEQLRRQREVEAAGKAAREAEKAKQREKEEKEEAIYRAQEALEERLEKYSTRRVPLGTDRHHRRYWWGLAGHRPAVYVEDLEGRWGSISSLADLDALMASLDHRGVRELALAEAIEKRFQTIAIAMQRAERAAAVAGGDRKQQERERAEPARRSRRQTHQVEFFDPVKGGSKSAGGSSPQVDATGLAALFGPAECAGIEAAAEEMLELQKAAGSVASPPEGCVSWKAWAAEVKAAAEGKVEGVATASAAAVRGLLQGNLVQLEAALMAESVGGLAADGELSDEEGSKGGNEQEASGEGSPAGDGSSSREQSVQVLDVWDEPFHPTKCPEVASLWKSQRERSAWQADLRQASTAAHLAYCAAVLAQQAGPMLFTLRKASSSGSGGGKKGKGSSKESGGGIKAASAEARMASKAAAAASSRPVSRANSTAQLDAGDAKGKGQGKGSKRKVPPPPPENIRISRSRHRSGTHDL